MTVWDNGTKWDKHSLSRSREAWDKSILSQEEQYGTKRLCPEYEQTLVLIKSGITVSPDMVDELVEAVQAIAREAEGMDEYER